MGLKFVSGLCIASLLVGSALGACGSSDDKKKAPRPDGMAGAGGESANDGGSGGSSGKGTGGDAGAPMTAQGGEPSSGGAGAPMTAQGGEPSSEPSGGAGGQAPVEFRGLYVSPDGDDAAAGTEAEPFKTVEHAASVAVAGDTIVFLDGSYTVGVEPVTIPSGVDVVAQNAGMVTLSGDRSTVVFDLAGDTRIAGLAFETVERVAQSAKGTLEVHDSVFTNCTITCFQLSGEAKAVILGAAGEVLGNGGAAFATLSETASLQLTGGVLQNYGSGGAIRAIGAASVELTDLDVQDGTGFVLSLKGTSRGVVTGANIATKSQTVFEQTDQSELSVSDSDVASTAAAPFHCFGAPATVKLSIATSKVHGCNTGIKGAIPVELTLTDSEFYDLAFGADLDTGGPNPGGKVRVSGCNFHDATYVALRIGNADPLLDLKMRDTVIDVTTMANWHALTIAAGNASTIDLGTLAEPGGNTFLQRAAGAAAVALNMQATTVQAVGNTWTPLQQGADETGHYVVQTGKVLEIKAATTSGVNYIKGSPNTTLVLAQIP